MSDEHDSHHAPYKFIFGLLCVFTAMSWLADEAKERGFFESHAVVVVIVLAVASMKALCVMMYFMHLKFERNWKYVLLAPTTILAIGLPLALMPDVGVHYYDVDVPQNPIKAQAQADDHHTSPKHDAHPKPH